MVGRVAALGVILPVYYANARRTLDRIETWLDAFDTAPRIVILDFVAQVDSGPPSSTYCAMYAK